jgi:hypothetical protein
VHPSPPDSHELAKPSSNLEHAEPERQPTEYKYDNAVIQASLVGLLIQFLLAVAIAVLLASIRFTSGTGSSLAQCLVLGGIWAEFGLGLFLCHCVYLFPRESPSRFMGAIGSVAIAGIQLAPITAGYGLGPLFVYVVGICVAGWFMHRVFGASLSMGRAIVYQDALNTKVLLLLAPLLLILGFVPLVTFVAMGGGQMPPNFASLIVYAAIIMLGVSIFPIITIYLGFFLLRLPGGLSLATFVFLALLAATPMILEWIQFSRVSNSAVVPAAVLSYMVGLGLGYLPFHLHGFRPVWAKRKHNSNVESPVSFDDVL